MPREGGKEPAKEEKKASVGDGWGGQENEFHKLAEAAMQSTPPALLAYR